MEIYFVKSAACLAILLLFYKLLLEKENMHLIKRAFLLLAVVASIVIPLTTFTTYVQPASRNFEPVFLATSEEIRSGSMEITEYLPHIFWFVYFSGVLFFSIKFIRNLKELVTRIRKNPQIKRNRFTNVLLSEKVSPHTFFSYIFLNKSKFERREIPREVLVHEEAHALQKHSIDILLIELFQIIFWLNPFIFFLKNAVKLNHEFLADRAVILHGVSTPEYQKTLLLFSSGELQSDLVNPINYSSIKKRFTVMKTKTSKKTIWARSLLLLPVLAGLFYSFSTKEVVERETENLNSAVGNYEILELRMDEKGKIFQQNKMISLSEVKNLNWKNYTNYAITISPDAPKSFETEFVTLVVNQGIGGSIKVGTLNETESKDNNLPYIIEPLLQKKSAQEKATPEMIAEYNRLVKYYNEMPKDRQVIKQEDINRIMYILSIMSPEQKKNAEKINFKVPPPPPPAPAPTPVKSDGKQMVLPPSPPPAPMPINSKEVNLLPTPAVQDVPPPPAPKFETPQIPPPPPPPSYEDLVEKGATFYYKDKIITPEEALRLVRVEKKVNVQIIDIDTNPVVKLTDKKKE